MSASSIILISRALQTKPFLQLECFYNHDPLKIARSTILISVTFSVPLTEMPSFACN